MVHPLTDEPDWVYRPGFELYPSLAVEDPPAKDRAPLVIEGLHRRRNEIVVRFGGVASRESAAELRHRFLMAPIGNLAPLEIGEYFQHQLIGLRVFTSEGVEVGRVKDVLAVGRAKMLEVERQGALRDCLVPFLAVFVSETDPADGRLVLDRSAEELLDL